MASNVVTNASGHHRSVFGPAGAARRGGPDLGENCTRRAVVTVKRRAVVLNGRLERTVLRSGHTVHDV